jgi:hypothetical protein
MPASGALVDSRATPWLGAHCEGTARHLAVHAHYERARCHPGALGTGGPGGKHALRGGCRGGRGATEGLGLPERCLAAVKTSRLFAQKLQLTASTEERAGHSFADYSFR